MVGPATDDDAAYIGSAAGAGENTGIGYIVAVFIEAASLQENRNGIG